MIFFSFHIYYYLIRFNCYIFNSLFFYIPVHLFTIPIQFGLEIFFTYLFNYSNINITGIYIYLNYILNYLYIYLTILHLVIVDTPPLIHTYNYIYYFNLIFFCISNYIYFISFQYYFINLFYFA